MCLSLSEHNLIMEQSLGSGVYSALTKSRHGGSGKVLVWPIFMAVNPYQHCYSMKPEQCGHYACKFYILHRMS